MPSHPWNELIARLPEPHLLQTYEWGQVKAHYGWQPVYLIWTQAGARFEWSEKTDFLAQIDPMQLAGAALVLKKSVLRRNFAARLCILYAPKGPLLCWEDAALRQHVLDDLQKFALKQGAIFLKTDPDVVLGRGVPGSESDTSYAPGLAVQREISARGWRYASDQIQFKNTVLLDVSVPEEDMLARMKQKTRYNVRLGAKKGLTVRPSTPADWPLLYRMYAETSVRDGFVIRDQAYYETVWQTFAHCSTALIAELEGEPVAAVYLFHFAGRAYYIYGMSREAHRDKMPNYLLQWEAMRWARAQGCTVYDLWGAPDEFNENDSMWGVFRFKEGLGGEVQRSLGAWDFAPNPLWYALYTNIVPRLIDLMRSRGKARVARSVQD